MGGRTDPVSVGRLRLTRREWLALSATLTRAARAQEPEPTFTSNVKVVSILATVLDRQKRIVHDLGKDDFTVMENGRPQALKYFSRDTDLPLTLGLMVDTSMSQSRVMDAERAASYRFLDRVLRPDKDQVFILHFDMDVKIDQALTNSLGDLRKALAYVDTPTRAQLEAQYGGGTLLFDAVVRASHEFLGTRQGRKAVIVMSDGGENGSDAGMQDAIDAAHKSDTMVYSILFGGSEGRRILQRMSHETGGGYFEVSKKFTIDQVFAAIQDELRSQYNLGYVSDVPVRISEFRKLAVAVKEAGYTVQARDRYWAQR
ncbi:MAG: VWA domain-containing protein [Acidobacteriota bacterium]|nr:VWA domain-containing protein [Acidobacteriota bacterium]